MRNLREIEKMNNKESLNTEDELLKIAYLLPKINNKFLQFHERHMELVMHIK